MPYKPLLEQACPALAYSGADLAGNALADFVITGDGHLEVPDDQFDIVVSTQVLEHVADPRLYLAEAFRVLKPGGCLLISTHGYWWYHPDPTDFWRWTGEGLRRIIRLQGFEVLASRGIGNLASASVQLFQDATTGFLPARLRKYYGAAMQQWAALVERLTGGSSNDDAIIYVITARKPDSALQS
jgi:SAM-dependent methyltransferase